MPQKVILIIRDGWGYSKKSFGNMIKQADTSWTDKMEKIYPSVLLETSGETVGLPKKFVGNSEVGHITIGAGRKIEQMLSRINNSIKDKSFFRNKVILKSIQNVKKYQSKLHLISILQKEGVHGYLSHLEAILKYAKKEGLKNDDVVIHLFTDGRDAHPENAVKYLAELAEIIYQNNIGIVATICGRYFGMDRDNRWERTEQAYQAIINSQGKKFDCGIEELEESYQKGITDEFIKPLVKNGYQGFQKNDSVFFVNFRKDRAKQLTTMILEKNKDIVFISMTEYDSKNNIDVVFEDIVIKNTWGDVLEKVGKSQLRISETEKFAHVTYFFDGGSKKVHQNRKDILVPSPPVNTYDLQPEMSSADLTKILCQEIKNFNNDFILLNFPNVDMVGHTGNEKATKKAVEKVDECCQIITEMALKKDYLVALTADHGNAEEMLGKNITSHSKNPVQFTIISSQKIKLKKQYFWEKKKYSLQNIAPTILDLMNIKKPQEMSESLILKTK